MKDVKIRAERKNMDRIQKYFSSALTLTILSLIGLHQRPSQIAKRLGMTDSALYYHTDKLRDHGLISKDGDRSGISWKLTDKGLLILKELNRQSVDGRTNTHRSRIAVRLHDVVFTFPVHLVPDRVDVKWKQLKHGVFKCKIDHHLTLDSDLSSIEQKPATVQLIKSPNEWRSALIIEMAPQHFTSPLKGIVELHNDAIEVANDIAYRYQIRIDQRASTLVKKPHMAFDKNLLAVLLGSTATAKVPTRNRNGGDGHAWIDGSLGEGEIETDDLDYYYLALTMPETVQKIAEMSEEMRRFVLGSSKYEGCYHPCRTRNN